MTGDNLRSLLVLVCSNGNPAAMLLAAGGPRGRSDVYDTILVEGVGGTASDPDVVRAGRGGA